MSSLSVTTNPNRIISKAPTFSVDNAYHYKTNLVMEGADIIMDGNSLSERLERIENLLHIPTRDVKLEEKYQHLKEIWEQYNHELEIIKLFETLKKD